MLLDKETATSHLEDNLEAHKEALTIATAGNAEALNNLAVEIKDALSAGDSPDPLSAKVTLVENRISQFDTLARRIALSAPADNGGVSVSDQEFASFFNDPKTNKVARTLRVTLV